MHFGVRSSSRVLFWQDVSRGDNSLKTHFPYFFRMAPFKDATLHEMIS